MNYETIKRNYDRGLWNKELVRKAVKHGFINAEQYFEITGEKY